MKALATIFFAVLLILAASIQPASGISVTIDTAQTDADTLVFDVVWGSSTPSDATSDSDIFSNGSCFYWVTAKDFFPETIRLMDIGVFNSFSRSTGTLDEFGMRYDESRLFDSGFPLSPNPERSISPLESDPHGARLTYQFACPDGGPGFWGTVVTFLGIWGVARKRRLRSV